MSCCNFEPCARVTNLMRKFVLNDPTVHSRTARPRFYILRVTDEKHFITRKTSHDIYRRRTFFFVPQFGLEDRNLFELRNNRHHPKPSFLLGHWPMRFGEYLRR